jgi:hypothetical protein
MAQGKPNCDIAPGRFTRRRFFLVMKDERKAQIDQLWEIV